MHFSFTAAADHLRADLYDRETVAETQQFIRELAAEAQKTGRGRLLVWVRKSRPIFTVEHYRVSEFFAQLATNPAVRVALLADADDLRASHEEIEVLARQQGANLRSFHDEPAALDWLRAQSQEKR